MDNLGHTASSITNSTGYAEIQGYAMFIKQASQDDENPATYGRTTGRPTTHTQTK
ncbi:MAG: hypothetical protein QXT26_06920 [Thermoproteota archaeon]